MTNQTQFFTEEEVLASVVDILNDGFRGSVFKLTESEIAPSTYLSNPELAENALKEYGIFKALKQVKEYEEEFLGSVETDLTNPEKVANMLYFSIAQPLIYSVVNDAIGSLKILSDADANAVVEFIKNKLN